MTGHEFVFYKKLIPSIHMFLFYNNSKTEQIKIQNNFGLILDQKLAFQYHVNEKIKDAVKEVGSQAATYFTSSIATDYLQIVCKP